MAIAHSEAMAVAARGSTTSGGAHHGRGRSARPVQAAAVEEAVGRDGQAGGEAVAHLLGDRASRRRSRGSARSGRTGRRRPRSGPARRPARRRCRCAAPRCRPRSPRPRWWCGRGRGTAQSGSSSAAGSSSPARAVSLRLLPGGPLVGQRQEPREHARWGRGRRASRPIRPGGPAPAGAHHLSTSRAAPTTDTEDTPVATHVNPHAPAAAEDAEGGVVGKDHGGDVADQQRAQLHPADPTGGDDAVVDRVVDRAEQVPAAAERIGEQDEEVLALEHAGWSARGRRTRPRPGGRGPGPGPGWPGTGRVSSAPAPMARRATATITAARPASREPEADRVDEGATPPRGGSLHVDPEGRGGDGVEGRRPDPDDHEGQEARRAGGVPPAHEVGHRGRDRREPLAPVQPAPTPAHAPGDRRRAVGGEEQGHRPGRAGRVVREVEPGEGPEEGGRRPGRGPRGPPRPRRRRPGPGADRSAPRRARTG